MYCRFHPQHAPDINILFIFLISFRRRFLCNNNCITNNFIGKWLVLKTQIQHFFNIGILYINAYCVCQFQHSILIPEKIITLFS